jgi:subfamily B ATP-binding cassette protein MsbA
MNATLRFLGLGLRSILRHKAPALGFIIASLAESLAAAATLWVLKHFLDLISAEGKSSTGGLALASGLIFAAWMARAVSAGLAKISEGQLLKCVSVTAMLDLAKHLLRQSVAFFDGASRGDLIQAVRGDVLTMYQSVHCLCVFVSSCATFLALAATAFWISPRLCIIALVVVPLLALPIGALGGKLLDNARKGRKTGFMLMDRLMDLCAGLRLIKIYRSEEYELREYKGLADRHYALQVRATRYQALAGVLLEAIAGCGMVLVLVLGGFEVLAGRLSWASLLTFVMALTTLFEPVRKGAHIYAAVQQYTPGMERLGELLARKPDIDDRPNARALGQAPRRLSLEGVSFDYGHEPVLRDLNLEIRAGEVIGIVGPSGAGKSTLMSLLLRFYDPTSGRICIDGTDLRDVQLGSLYDHLSAVLQTPFVFNATVRENIRYARMDAADEEVERAARDANLHDEILGLPLGYDTRLGLGGQDLSGGQRQRLNIARALLKDAPILLLDEATSSLDSVSEVRVQEAIERLMVGRTVIAIAHRLSTLRCADRIVVLRDGRVEAVGSHDELLRASPTYLALCRHQFVSLDAGAPNPREVVEV